MGMKTIIFAGVVTFLQAVVQLTFSSLSLAQYYCLINFLQELPLLLYIRILYYHNPGPCGARINIGHAIDGMVDQAFVLITDEPLTTTRTFYINCTSTGLGALWLLASAILMTGGMKNEYSKPIRWPWIMVSVAICAVDVVATVIFANDSFYTRTLSDIMSYVGGVASGTGNVQLDTSFAAWVMVMLYSRFVVFFIINVLLIIVVALQKNAPVKRDVVAIETPASPTIPSLPPPPPLPPPVVAPVEQITCTNNGITPVHTTESRTIPENMQQRTAETRATNPPPPLSNITEAPSNISSTRDTDSTERGDRTPKIPRAGFSQAYRTMKKLLFARESPAPRRNSLVDSLVDVSPQRSPQSQRVEEKRSVNFPESLMSLPQRLENMIAEQQRRLDRAVIDTAGRASQSLPQLNETSQDAVHMMNRGRRGTAAELQGQLPWAYIPAPAHRMRDHLPPDEELPPVPLPDYTAIPSFRKASVHRAASSLSSLTQKREFMSQLPKRKSLLTQSDVLY